MIINRKSYLSAKMSCPGRNDSIEDMEKDFHSYANYLQLEDLLSLQKMKTWDSNEKKIHEEHIFLTAHQVYELWFKQLIVEIDSVREILKDKAMSFDLNSKSKVLSRLNRIKAILELMVNQIKVIKTISDIDFLEFRDRMKGGSGFDSYQFRIFENKYGVKEKMRTTLNENRYTDVFKNKSILEKVLKSEEEKDLFEYVQTWLENIPELDNLQFVDKYKNQVQNYLNKRKALIQKFSNEDLKVGELNTLKKFEEKMSFLYDENEYNIHLKTGQQRFSQRAFQAIVMIWSFSTDSSFIISHQILKLLKEIDEIFATWRYQHALMAQGIIGSKTVGTGTGQGLTETGFSVSTGSSGYHYLKATTSDSYRVFHDLFNVVPFMLPDGPWKQEILRNSDE